MSEVARADSAVWCRRAPDRYTGSNTASIYYVGKVGIAAAPRADQVRLVGSRATEVAGAFAASDESDPLSVLRLLRTYYNGSLPKVMGAVAILRSCPCAKHEDGAVTEANTGRREVVGRHIWTPGDGSNRFHARRDIDPDRLVIGSDGVGFIQPVDKSSGAAARIPVVSLPLDEDERQLVTRIDAVPMVGSFGDRNAVYALVHVIEGVERDIALERLHPFALAPSRAPQASQGGLH